VITDEIDPHLQELNKIKSADGRVIKGKTWTVALLYCEGAFYWQGRVTTILRCSYLYPDIKHSYTDGNGVFQADNASLCRT